MLTSFVSLFCHGSCDPKTSQYEQQTDGGEQMQTESTKLPSPSVGDKRPREEDDENIAPQALPDPPSGPRANIQPPTGPAAMAISNGASILTQAYGTSNAGTNGLASVGSDALCVGDLQWVSWSSFIYNVSCTVLMYSNSSMYRESHF